VAESGGGVLFCELEQAAIAKIETTPRSAPQRIGFLAMRDILDILDPVKIGRFTVVLPGAAQNFRSARTEKNRKIRKRFEKRVRPPKAVYHLGSLSP
jgi:hypothetical protein